MAELTKLHTGLTERPAIIFVHGLEGHPIQTWQHESCAPDDCWPHWLGKATDSDVWTLSYEAPLSAWNGNDGMAISDYGDTAPDCLSSELGLAGRSLVLIGHSMGGLVIKTMMVNALSPGGDPRFKTVVDRICGVVFVSTPHGGSQLANVASAVGWTLRANQHVVDMKRHDATLRQLNKQFLGVVKGRELSVRAFAERNRTPVRRAIFGYSFQVRVRVVDDGSSDPGIANVAAVGLTEDHFSICRPAKPTKQIHTSVCQFIRDLPTPHAVRPSAALIAVPGTPAQTAVALPPAPLVPTQRPPREPGRLTGPTDSRLQSREGRLYGRADDVAKVQLFLSGNDPTHPDVALVVGSAGEGKTEVCKAALKSWLATSPASVAYFIELPDRGSVADLVFRIGNAIGNPTVESLEKLQAQLPAGLYYLDNLEGIAELPDGKDALRTLAQTPGVRLLASSRVNLATIFGKPVEIDRLPDSAALRLFRELWSGAEALPDDPQLATFVIDKLGAHALSVTLVARLGDTYPFATVCKRWDETGAALARDAGDDSRHGNLEVSLRLTAAALAPKHGTLALWTLAALFDEGLPDELLAQFEHEGGWADARPLLVAHHVIKRREGRWHMLPPLARYALNASLKDADGFSWVVCRAPVLDYFLRTATVAERIATADEPLAARRALIDLFPALCSTIEYEIQCTKRQSGWLDRIANNLINTYPFRISLSCELIVKMLPHLANSAGPTLRLGELESRLGRPEEARGLYEKALVLYEKKQDGLGQANTLRSLGVLENRLGRPTEARGLYEKALVLYEKKQDGLGQANTLDVLGDLERGLGRPIEARGLYEKALALYEKVQDGLGQANTLRSFGDLHHEAEQFDEALNFYRQAVDRYRTEQEPVGMAYTQAKSALCHSALGDANERDLALEEAFRAAKTLGVEGVTEYVCAVLAEVTGGDEQAQAWLAAHPV